MEKLKSALKGICSQLNSDSEKEIERGLKRLYGLIKNNGDLAEEDYNVCVDVLIENNYLDVIIFVLSLEAAKTKGTKSVHNINLRYVEIIFYSLNWLLRNKLGRTHPDDECQKKFVKSEAFRNVGLFLCEQMNLLEIAILHNFSYNRIFILNVILYLFLFHEKFHFVFRSSSLLLNLIELKKNLKTVSELKRKNELTHLENNGEELDDVIDDKVERARREILDGEEDQSVPTGDESLLGETSQNDDKSEEENSRDTKKGCKKHPTGDDYIKEDETLLCSYNFQNEVVHLYKHLLKGGAVWGVENERGKNRTVENCEFYAEMLIKKKNGKTKMFKDKIVDRKWEKQKRRKRSRRDTDEADSNSRAVSKDDFEAVRVAFLVMCAYCYLDSTRSDKTHTYFHTICEEIRKIYCSSGEALRHYIILCLYKILEKSETYKNMNVFLNVIKLVGIFFNDVQSEMDTTVLFFINELLKRRKFSEIYKNAKFNCNCIFLLKCSYGEENEEGQEEKKGKKRRSPSGSSPSASSYYLVVNCNRKDKGEELANMYGDLFDGTTNMQNKKYAQARNQVFVMGIQKRDIRRICLIFANLEMYITTCIRETKQYLITRHVKEEEEVILLRDKFYNDEKQIQNKVNNAFLSFLTDLKIKFFINHYIIVISIEKYQHFINLYYGSSKLHILTCDDNLFLFLLLFIDVSKIFFLHRTNGESTPRSGGKEMGRLPIEVIRYFSLPCSDMQGSTRSGTNPGEDIPELCHDEGATALTKSEKKRKMSSAVPSDEKGDNLRRKKKKLERSSSELVNNNYVNKSGEDPPRLLHYRYAYQSVNNEVVRNTNFLQLCGEVIHYKIFIELYDAVKEGPTENSEGAIIDRRVVMQNVKEANNYLHHLDNELNYKKKIEEVLFFFIPMNVTKYIVEMFTKRDKHNYYNYFIMCYLHYTFEIYKCVSMFILSLDSFLPFPQGVNKIVLMNRIKEDLSLAFYNLVSSYYLFDIAYINRYIINEIKGAQNNEVYRRDTRDSGNSGKRNNLTGAGIALEADPLHDSDSDDYTFNIGAKDHEIMNTRSEKNQEKREHILQLHYFLNDVHINTDNLYVYHFVLVTNFINLFDDCELKKKLLNELYSQKRIIEIRNFELFANVNENVYKIFLKLFFEKCYFPLESYHLLDNLFSILTYYKKRVLSPHEEGGLEVKLAFYSFVETLVHKMLRKTKFFDSSHVDDVLLFLNFLRAIRSLRQFVVALSVFCRLFNLHRSRVVHLDSSAPNEAAREVSIDAGGKSTNEFQKENPLRSEASPFFRLLVELFFTSNLNFALKGIPIMKVIKEEKQTKGGGGDVFDYTLEDIVQVYVNYLDYVKYVLLLNPYVYPSVREKLKNQRSLGELFCAFTRKKDFLQPGDNLCDSQRGGSSPSNGTVFNPPSEKPQSGVTNMVEGSVEKVAYQNESNKQKAVFVSFATFLQSVDAFLWQIEKVQMGQKNLAEYQEEIKHLCSEVHKKGVTNKARNNQSGSFFFVPKSGKPEIDRAIPNGGETVLEIYLQHNNVTFYYTSVDDLEGTKKKCEEAELLLYNLCNVSTLIVNYFFTTYVYLNGDGNVHSNTLLRLIDKISKTVEVFLALSATVNTNIHAFVEYTRRYEDVKNVIASCGSRKEQVDSKYDANNFFQKVRNLSRSMCSLFVHIFKNGLFVKLLDHLQKKLKTNRVVVHHFMHLILCYVHKGIQLFNLKREIYKRAVGESLVRLIHIIAEQETHKGDEKIKGKLSLMILSLLQMLDAKEYFMMKLIAGNTSSKGDSNQTDSDRNGGEASMGSRRSFLLKQIALFFVNLMRSEKEKNGFKVGLKNGMKDMHRSGANAVPLLIDTITRDERLEGETSTILNELCKLYVKKWYSNSGFPLSCAIVERVICHGIRGGENGTSDRSTIKHCFFRGIKNERTHMQRREDVEREVEAHVLQNYVALFDLKALPEEAACNNNTKENHIFMIFLYLMENKYTPSLFDQIDMHLLESVTHEEVFKLPRKNFSAMLAEIYLKKFAQAYKSVYRRRNRISFLLLSTKKAKNKNCLFIALSILYFLGNMLSRKERMRQLLREYGKDVVRRICEVAFFYFYGYFYKNDIPKGECMMRCYERVTFFVFKGVFKSLKRDRGEEEGGRRNSGSSAHAGNQNGCVRNPAARREDWRVPNSVEMSSHPTQHGNNNAVKHGGNSGNTIHNESFTKGKLRRRNDHCILLVLLLQMLNQNVGKFKMEKMMDGYLCDLLTDLAFCARGKKNHFYYENAMKDYMYIFSEHDVGELKKDKKLYAVFYAFFLLLKYVKLRNLGALMLVEAFFRDAHVERLIVQQLEAFRGKRGVGKNIHGGNHDECDDERGDEHGVKRSGGYNDECNDGCHGGNKNTLLFILKLVKIFYEEWYDQCREKAPQTQVICLKTLNRDLFNALKKAYSYTLESVDVHIRNIFFVDISHYLKSVTMESILDNKLIDEVLKFKEFNLNNDGSYDWLNMNTSMLNKTCLYFYMNENVRRKLESGENHFLFYLHMNRSGQSECCEREVYPSGEEFNHDAFRNGDANGPSCVQSDDQQLGGQKGLHSDYCQTEWKMKKGELLLKLYRTKLPHCIMSQNEYTKREAFFLAHRLKLEDNIYDYLFLLCLIVSKLIFCFVLMAEKLRIFFYHFRILYTSYRHENVFLNFDLLNMQEINRKIKNYIRKYPDIHFYIDYDNNEDEERGGAHGEGNLVGGGMGDFSRTYHGNNDETDPHNSYNGGIHRTNEHTKRGFPFGSSNKLISYDEEKEHFYHLKKNEKNNSNCKFCIKFKQIHSVHRSTRILDLLDKEEKTNIKNMIYYGKTIRTSIFLSSPYEGNAYKNCSTFREEPQEEVDGDVAEEGFQNGGSDKGNGDNKQNGVGNESADDGSADRENSCKENGHHDDHQNGVEGNYTAKSATQEKTCAKGKLAKMKKNYPTSSINTDCIVDSNDLLYGRKMKDIHFKKNYKKLLKRYLLNDIDFFGKWIKIFSMNALKILIFCLSSNDIIVRMISIKGLSIFYQLIENSFVLYKIRKRLNSFRRSGGATGQAEEADGHGVIWKNSLSQRYHNSGSSMHNSGVRKKKQRMLVIPFKELFYLFFFMKKLKYSVDPNSYYINPSVSTYSFFLINEIYKKKGFRDTLKNLIRNKTFSIHFFHAYLNNQFRKTNFMSLNVINFLIISTQALFSTRYDLRGSDREIEGESGENYDEEYEDHQQGGGQNYDEEYADHQQGGGENYDEEYADHQRGGNQEYNGSYAPHKPHGGSTFQQHDGGYSTRNANYTTSYDQNGYYVDDNPYNGSATNAQRKSNTIDRSFFATSNVNHRMIYDFQNEDEDVEEGNEKRNRVTNKEDEEEAVDKLQYIQGNHKNAIKTILNILNKNNIFEIYLTMFFSNYLNYNLLKKFLILLVMCSGVLLLEDMQFDCVGGGDAEERRRNGGSDGDAHEQQNGSGHVYYGESRAQENAANGTNGASGTDQNNCDVAYYVKNNLVLKLITRNNILLWLDRIMHQKLFQDEIAFYYPTSFTMPVINFYDTDGQNEKHYMSSVNVEADCSGGKGEEEVISFGRWDPCYTSNRRESFVKKGMHKSELEEGGSITGEPKKETGKIKAQLNDNRSSREKEEPLTIVLCNQTHIEKITKNRYIMGYIFKESYEKTSEIFFYLSLFVSNIVSNLFYPSVDYAHIFTNALLKKEKKKIKRFILNNAQKVINQKGEPSKGNSFELWNFWYSNLHKYISLKVRSTFIIRKEASKLKKSNLNIFSDLIKIIKNLNRSLYYIFMNLFHMEYFNLFINVKSQGERKESAKQRERNLTADHTTNIREMKKANLKTCRTFVKYIFLMFNNLFSICTSLFDRGVPNGEFAQNSISTKVAVEESFINEDLSFVLNEVMVFLENVVVLHSYFSSLGLRKPSVEKNHRENKQHRNGRRAIESYHIDIHNTLLKRTHAKSPNRSNYAYYRKIIHLVLHMLRKKCYNENKHFGYIFLNKLITVYHFLEGTSRAKVYLYIYELLRMTKRNPIESLLNQVL